MSRLIGADRLKEIVHRNTVGDLFDQFIDIIDIQPTVKAIPLDEVKKAREEMKECSYSLSCFNADVFDEDEKVVDLDNVLIILDKLIESENE